MILCILCLGQRGSSSFLTPHTHIYMFSVHVLYYVVATWWAPPRPHLGRGLGSHIGTWIRRSTQAGPACRYSFLGGGEHSPGRRKRHYRCQLPQPPGLPTPITCPIPGSVVDWDGPSDICAACMPAMCMLPAHTLPAMPPDAVTPPAATPATMQPPAYSTLQLPARANARRGVL